MIVAVPMNRLILLDISSFNSLRQAVPTESLAAKAIAQAGVVGKGGRYPDGTALIECTESDARELLQYAEKHCPDAVPAISKVFRTLKPFGPLQTLEES